MTILSVLVKGNETPPLPLPPFVPPVEVGLEADVPVPRVPARLRVDCPLSQCSVNSALGEDDPGFVVPKAQMMFSVPTVET